MVGSDLYTLACHCLSWLGGGGARFDGEASEFSLGRELVSAVQELLYLAVKWFVPEILNAHVAYHTVVRLHVVRGPNGMVYVNSVTGLAEQGGSETGLAEQGGSGTGLTEHGDSGTKLAEHGCSEVGLAKWRVSSETGLTEHGDSGTKLVEHGCSEVGLAEQVSSIAGLAEHEDWGTELVEHGYSEVRLAARVAQKLD
ncbi:hypothetical protein BHM03_00044663 [Ensete ventricosum]|nr:hypothetical protein BHM03_00044663 [Ensete ventricosum]